MRKESSIRSIATLPVKGPENGAVTVVPARTVRGRLIVIVVSKWGSGGVSRDRASILTVATVRRMSVDALFVTVMMPTIFPSGPDGWTTFWTVAVNLRLGSSMIVTVMWRRPGAAIAVTNRTTDRIGSGRRCFFRPQGARRRRVSVTVHINGIPPELRVRAREPAIPSFHLDRRLVTV